MDYDIAIAGAGMIGATLSCALTRLGLRVALIDPFPATEFDPQSEPDIRVSAVSYSSEQILRHLHLWPAIQATRVCPFTRLAVSEQTMRLPSWLPSPPASRTEFSAADTGHSHLGHIVENTVLRLVPFRAAQQDPLTTVFCPATINEITYREHHVALELDTGDTVTATALVGADGANSQVRHSAGIGCFNEQYAQHVFAVMLEYSGVQQSMTWQEFHPSGPRAFLPLMDVEDKHYASLVWYDAPETVTALMGLNEDALRQRIQAAFPDELPPITRICKQARFPIAKMHAYHYGKPGLYLVGDAAHTINPLAGQGLNLGYLDIAELYDAIADTLAAGGNVRDPGLVQRYEAKRRANNSAMMHLMDAFYLGFSNDTFALKALRQLGLGLADRMGLAKQHVMQYAMGMKGTLPSLASDLVKEGSDG